MKTMAMFNDDAAYKLGLSFESIYIAGYLLSIKNTSLVETEIIDGEEWFSFNLVDLFKKRKMVFEQFNNNLNLSENERKEVVNKLYNKNKSRFERLLRSDLSKVLIRGKNIKYKGGSKTYYKFDRVVLTTLINGLPKVVDTKLTDNEQLLSDTICLSEIPKGIRTQLKGMDTELLKEAIEIAKEKGILDFPYIKKIYNNLLENKKDLSVGADKPNELKNNINGNSISQNNKNMQEKNKNTKNWNKDKVKIPITTQHMVSDHIHKYEEAELEIILQESQKGKFDNQVVGEIKKEIVKKFYSKNY